MYGKKGRNRGGKRVCKIEYLTRSFALALPFHTLIRNLLQVFLALNIVLFSHFVCNADGSCRRHISNIKKFKFKPLQKIVDS